MQETTDEKQVKTQGPKAPSALRLGFFNAVILIKHGRLLFCFYLHRLLCFVFSTGCNVTVVHRYIKPNEFLHAKMNLSDIIMIRD